MRDLIRNYKLTIQRKRAEDSETETEPLVGSSSSSTTSFGTIRPIPRVFDHDSYSSESDAAESFAQKSQSTPAVGSSPLKIHQKPIFENNRCDTRFDVYPLSSQYFYEKYRNYSNISDSGILDGSNNLIETRDFDMTQLSESQEKRAPTQNSIVTIFSIWNTTMGSSLLAMAWGMQKAGLIPGIIITILVGTICFYTAYLLLNVNEKHGVIDKRIEVCDLCRMLIGSWADFIARIFSVVVLVGACIVYWVLMSNFLYNAVYFIRDVIVKPIDDISDRLFNTTAVICPKMQLNLTMNNHYNNMDNIMEEKSTFVEFWQLYSTVPIILALLIFPVLNFKNATFFTKFNSLGTLSAIYLILFVAFKASVWGVNIPSFDDELMVKPSFGALSGMLSLSFFIHNIILSILKNNKHPENNTRDLSIAFALVALTYLAIGALFYTAFPLMKECIEDNLLNNFNQYDVLTLVARLLLLFQLITVYPLLAFMLRQDILVNINKFTKSNNSRLSEEPTFSLFPVLFINLLLLVVCVLFACFLPKIGTLIRYIGALSGLFYIHLFPSLLKIASLRKEDNLTIPKLIFYIVLIIIGIANLFMQFFIVD